MKLASTPPATTLADVGFSISRAPYFPRLAYVEGPTGSPEIRISTCEEGFPWDRHVEASPYGCFAHATGWLEALRKLTGADLQKLVIRKGNTVVAVCPVFVQRRGPLRLAYSPPLAGAVHHMGPAFMDYDSLTDRNRIRLLTGYQSAFDTLIEQGIRCNYVELRFPPGFLDARALQWAGYRIRLLYTRVVDLGAGPQAALRQSSPALRRNVRKCEGRVVSRAASSEELPAFLRIVQSRYREVGARYPLSSEFLSDLFRNMGPSRIQLFLAEEAGEIQTGLILALHRHRATVWHGSARPQSSQLPVGDHLHWSALQWAHEHGFREFELMDADSARLEEFKSKFNGRLLPVLHAERSKIWHRVAERIGRDRPALF